MQLQHQSTWRQASPADLPVECIPEALVGVLPFLFPPPDGFAAVLDDNTLPSIFWVFRVCLEKGDQNMNWESTPVAPTHVPLPARPQHHRSRGSVFVCVCVCMCVLNGKLSLFDVNVMNLEYLLTSLLVTKHYFFVLM